jgi:hypothetical protein
MTDVLHFVGHFWVAFNIKYNNSLITIVECQQLKKCPKQTLYHWFKSVHFIIHLIVQCIKDLKLGK